MVRRNSNFDKLKESYLFVDIAARKKAFTQSNPDVKLISLGIGDTSEPLTSPTLKGLLDKVGDLGTKERYSGYPEYNGTEKLRKLIAEVYYKDLNITSEEIFISDGSKPDLARLQSLFGPSTTVAVQDPVYPAYVDGSVITGKAGEFDSNTNRYTNLTYMSCTPENKFFPDLTSVKRTDLIFFCSPNNPTGVAATKHQLTELVAFAKKNNSIIIFDSAYSSFITRPDIPHSIFEIDGAHEVSFETSSFSKSIGYTGVRLGWTVCPKGLKYGDGTPVWKDWARIMGTFFNGPSNIAENGAIATLQPEGLVAMKEMVDFYLENTRIILEAMKSIGYECYGGVDSPYIWIRVPGRDSWDVFQEILEKAHVVTTPGSGFGTEGSNFIRISAFAHREDVVEAVNRLKVALKSATANGV